MMVELKVANQARGSCFKPYSAQRRGHTFCGVGEVLEGGFIYTSLDKIRNAFLTSI